MIIGIEGPAGSGKSTMARTVAAELGTMVIEGGAWYRALTFVAHEKGLDLQDTAQLVTLAKNLGLQVLPASDGSSLLMIGDRDITKDAYSEETSVRTPIVAAQIPVREIIEPLILAAALNQELSIVIGRHLYRMFPEVRVLRLTIDEAEAERRHKVRAGEIAQSVKERNRADAEIHRRLSVPHDGQVEVDVSGMTQEEQAEVLRQFITSEQAS